MSLHHIVWPSAKNQYHPHLLRLPVLTVLTIAFVLTLAGLNYQRERTPNILGTQSAITADELLIETNIERQEVGQGTLTLNEQLTSAAQKKAEHMAANNYWSHVAPDGTTPWKFFKGVGYEYQKAGENLAYGFKSTDAVVEGWMNSPSHKANMLDDSFTDAGFGVVQSPSFQGRNTVIVVAMYGRPADAPAPINSQLGGETGDQAAVLPIESVATESVRTGWLPAALHGYLSPTALYLSLGLLFVGLLFAVRHLHGLYQLLRHGEHYLRGHPMAEAFIVYTSLWLLITTGFSAVF